MGFNLLPSEAHAVIWFYRTTGRAQFDIRTFDKEISSGGNTDNFTLNSQTIAKQLNITENPIFFADRISFSNDPLLSSYRLEVTFMPPQRPIDITLTPAGKEIDLELPFFPIKILKITFTTTSTDPSRVVARADIDGCNGRDGLVLGLPGKAIVENTINKRRKARGLKPITGQKAKDLGEELAQLAEEEFGQGDIEAGQEDIDVGAEEQAEQTEEIGPGESGFVERERVQVTPQLAESSKFNAKGQEYRGKREVIDTP